MLLNLAKIKTSTLQATLQNSTHAGLDPEDLSDVE